MGIANPHGFAHAFGRISLSPEATMYLRTLVLVLAVSVLGPTASAQVGTSVSGRLVNTLSGDPVANAVVQIDELNRMAISATDGRFTFDNVPPGAYHISIRSQGYSTRRTEVIVGPATPTLMVDITGDPELHFEEVTTVTGDARSQFEIFQPTAVLAGQELSKQLEMSLGGTLETSRVSPREASDRRQRVP
jgi:iron complex outermembrane receptor protein